MNPTSLLWRDLTLATGRDAPYRIHTLEGWEDRPPARYDKQPRSRGHGTHRSTLYSDERTVTVEGWCHSAEERDELLFGLQAVGAYAEDDDTEPLTVTAAGRTLWAGGQLLEARPMLTRGQWGIGRFGWLLQWRCPDPLRYGAARTSEPVGLPTAGGGLTYPLSYPLSYGAAGSTGRVTLTNAGTAPAPVVLAVRGDLPGGVELSSAATGERLTYVAPIPGAQVVEFDTAAGTVLVEGTSSRRAALTAADWLHVPARDRRTGEAGELTVQLTSLSTVTAGGAQLTATTQDTYW